MERRGHRPIYFAAGGRVDARLTKEAIEVVSLDQPALIDNTSRLSAAVQGVWNRPAATALTRLLASLPQGHTVVHVHGWAKGLSPSIAHPVYTMHEFFLFCPNGGYYHYREGRARGLRPMSQSS